MESQKETPFNWEPTGQGDIKASKESYFAWARENSFAPPQATNPEEYLFAVSCNIQDQAAQGFMVDVAASSGNELVYRKSSKRNLNKAECDALAKQVLGM